jgi:glutamine amidotransferase
MTRVGIVDYGMGNRRSVEKALERAGAIPVITADHDELRSCDGLVLPGVGAFPEAMRRLRESGLDELLCSVTQPLIGLCLGMQLLFESSAEHEGATGLGVLPGTIERLDTSLKVPHIGWNEVSWVREDPLLDGLPNPAAFYHVHTYVPTNADLALGWGDYGGRFVSVVARDHVYGTQSHPEKSSTNGIRLLANFTAICSRVAA